MTIFLLMSVKKIVLKSIQGLPREGQRCVFVIVRRFDDDNGASSGYTRRYGAYSVYRVVLKDS